MKFLCPSCKAKYQVPDEKIAGRSLRMKCRKCEFLISLSEAPLAPPTLAPTSGELVPRLPGPPAVPDLGSSPPWVKAPAAATARRPTSSVRPALHGAAALAAEPEPIGDVTPNRDEQPVEQWFVEIKGSPVGPLALSVLREKAGAGDISLQSLVWRDGDEDWKPLSSVPELVAIVEERLSRARGVAPPRREEATATPPPLPAAATDEPTPPPSAAGPASADLAAAGLKRQRLPVSAWVAVVVAMLLGLTIGFVVFGEQKQAAPAVAVAPAVAQGAESAAAVDEPAPPPPATEPLPSSAAPAQPALAVGARPAPAPARVGDKAPAEPAKEPSGAVSQPGGPSGESAPGGGPLDSATIESTVARYKASVKRSCWQPALEARSEDAPTSVRINVNFTIAPSGGVQNVTTSGDPRGYGGLANCIAGRVRGWQFPPSGSSTPVNVPFVFAGQ